MKPIIKKISVQQNILLPIFALFLFWSCDVLFESPQPAWVTNNEKEIPKIFRGTYTCRDLSFEDKIDTMQITSKRIFNKHQDIDFNLSDTVLLKYYNHAYFLNLYVREKKAWSVILAKPEKERIVYYMISSEDSPLLSRLKELTKMKEYKNSNGEIKDPIINPTTSEFKKMLKENIFTCMDTLTKIKL